jgi:hypothetical protein
MLGKWLPLKVTKRPLKPPKKKEKENKNHCMKDHECQKLRKKLSTKKNLAVLL